MIVTVEPAVPTLRPAELAWCLTVWGAASALREQLATADRSLLIILLACHLNMPARYVRGAVAWLERCGHLRQTSDGWEITPVMVAGRACEILHRDR